MTVQFLQINAANVASLMESGSVGTSVIPRAQLFTIPVVQFLDGERLVYPEGIPDHPAGTPIQNLDGRYSGDRGVIFLNHATDTYEGVVGNGTTAVILHQVMPATAEQLYRDYQRLIGERFGKGKPVEAKQYKILFAAAYSHGVIDARATTGADVSKLQPIRNNRLTMTVYNTKFGYVWNPYHVTTAVYVAHPFVLIDEDQRYFEEGGVIVKDERQRIDAVEWAQFSAWYMLVDGSPITDIGRQIAGISLHV